MNILKPNVGRILQGDCFDWFPKIPEESIDLICIDPPYGNMDTYGGRKLGINGWDKQLDTSNLYEYYNNILRKNGKLIIFSQEPYTTKLITNAIPSIPFSYRLIWIKDDFANPLGVNKAPVNFYEDILVFSKIHTKHDFKGLHPLRKYFKRVFEYIDKPKKNIIDLVGQRADHVFRFNSSQFSLCTNEVYNELINIFNLTNIKGFISFGELKEIDRKYRFDLINKMNGQYPNTFNLWEGKKYKSNVLKYKKDYTGLHPTQKPVKLIEDLIKTYSNEGNLILDNVAGSGTTGEACINTGRKFILMEKEEKYFDIIKERLNF